MHRFFIALVLCLAGPAAAQSPPCCAGYNLGPSYLGQVATGSYVQDTAENRLQQGMSRSHHFARQQITSLQLVFPNFALNADGTILGQNNDTSLHSATITASVEYPLGTCTQVKFGGVATGTMPATTGGRFIISDPVTVAIPNGARFWVRNYFVGSVGVYASFNKPTMTQGDTINANTTGVADQTVTCTTVPQQVHATTASVLVPVAIIAQTTRPSVCLIGDSIAATSNDYTEALYGQPLANTASFVDANLAWIAITRGSIQANFFAANTTTSNVPAALFQYCTHLFDELGINDLSNGGSRTVTQFEADLQTIYGAWSASGQSPKWIERTTLTPITTSSDSWKTTANQTVMAGEANIVTFNNDVRNLAFSTNAQTINGYIDIRSGVGTGTNFQFWKNATSPGGCAIFAPNSNSSSTWTDDGIHPNNCGIWGLYISGVFNLNHFHR